MVKIDTSKKGLEMIFKEWEVPLYKKLLTEDVEMITREAWEYILDQIYPQTLSRASVIFSLQEYAEKGILKASEITGKGGYRGVFSRNMTLDEFWQYVKNQVDQALEPHI